MEILFRMSIFKEEDKYGLSVITNNNEPAEVMSFDKMPQAFIAGLHAVQNKYNVLCKEDLYEKY